MNDLLFFSKENFLSSCGILLSGPHGTGKKTVTMATSRRLNLHILSVSCFALIGESLAATETRIKNEFERGLFNYFVFKLCKCHLG